MDVMDKDNKNKLLHLKKLIKVEPHAGQRLQSLRLPRDLSLGGTKLQKKQFVPNVNVTRNKQNVKEVVNRNGFDRKGRSDRNGTRNRSQNDKYVASLGIFSEGAASAIPISRRYASDRSARAGNEKENDGLIAAMAVPTIQKNTYKIDKETEDNVLEKLEGFNEEKDDEKYPFQPITWENGCFNQIKHDIKGIKIKKEETENSEVTPGFKELKLEPSEYSSLNYAGEYFQEDCLNNDKPSIALWSLPDSFAGKGLSDDPNCTKLFDYCLNDMLEGKIGKLVMRKSGKVEVHIGQVKYNLEPGDIDAYEEKIVSMETEKLHHAAVLGQIGNRYFLHPDWDSLFT